MEIRKKDVVDNVRSHQNRNRRLKYEAEHCRTWWWLWKVAEIRYRKSREIAQRWSILHKIGQKSSWSSSLIKEEVTRGHCQWCKMDQNSVMKCLSERGCCILKKNCSRCRTGRNYWNHRGDAVRRSRKQVWDMRKPVGTDFVLREQPVEKWSKTN
jgi:hypothetical protein